MENEISTVEMKAWLEQVWAIWQTKEIKAALMNFEEHRQTCREDWATISITDDPQFSNSPEHGCTSDAMNHTDAFLFREFRHLDG